MKSAISTQPSAVSFSLYTLLIAGLLVCACTRPGSLDQAQPVQTQAYLLPSGPAAVDYKGVIIMPGALAGEASPQAYTFTTESAVGDVADFYEDDLINDHGWVLSRFDKNEEDASRALIFKAGQGEEKELRLLITKAIGKEPLTLVTIFYSW